MMQPRDKSMATIVALASNRGFIYPGSELYGGLANSWDYGPWNKPKTQCESRLVETLR